jgi:hypothetical protein
MAASDTQVGGDHYQTAVQHHEFVRANTVPWHEANVIKYLMRHKRKNKIEDVKKAIHYTLLMAELEYPDQTEELKQAVKEMLD